jgi:molybdenum cofactor guanylyltransferase
VTPAPPEFTGAVLTGGRSSRMGTDKAMLEIGGRPLVLITAEALRSAGAAEVLAIGGDQLALAHLHLDARADDHPGEGPLGGLVTALRQASHDLVAVLACDMPTIDGPTVLALVEALAADPTTDGVVAVTEGRIQALTAVYRRRALGDLEAAFAAGERSVRRAIAGIGIAQVPDLDPDRLADVDRPADLRRYAQPP